MREKILIYGGSFDPVHSGHMALFRAGVEEISPHRAIILPAFRSAFKAKHFASYKDRLAMVKIAVSETISGQVAEVTEVSELEGSLGRRVYAREVLDLFSGEGREIWFLCGGDILEGLDRWADADRVSRLCSFLVGLSRGDSITIPAFKNNFSIRLLPRIIPGPALSGRLSSTSIRDVLSSGGACSPAAVSRGVMSFIRDRGLYGTSKVSA